jgi:hypothetical protein
VGCAAARCAHSDQSRQRGLAAAADRQSERLQPLQGGDLAIQLVDRARRAFPGISDDGAPTVVNSTIAGNTGGGSAAHRGSTTTLMNSTLSGDA